MVQNTLNMYCNSSWVDMTACNPLFSGNQSKNWKKKHFKLQFKMPNHWWLRWKESIITKINIVILCRVWMSLQTHQIVTTQSRQTEGLRNSHWPTIVFSSACVHKCFTALFALRLLLGGFLYRPPQCNATLFFFVFWLKFRSKTSSPGIHFVLWKITNFSVTLLIFTHNYRLSKFVWWTWSEAREHGLLYMATNSNKQSILIKTTINNNNKNKLFLSKLTLHTESQDVREAQHGFHFFISVFFFFSLCHLRT